MRDVSGPIIFTLALLYNTQCTTFFEMSRFIHVHSVIWCFCKTEKKCEGECPFSHFLALDFFWFLVLLVVLLGWNLTCTLSGHNVDSRITQFHCAVWLTLGLPSSPSFDQQRTKWLTSLPPNLYAFRFASFFPPLLSGCTLSFEFCTCVSSLTACMICLLIRGCVLASSVYRFHVHENYCRMTPDLWPLTPMHMVCSFLLLHRWQTVITVRVVCDLMCWFPMRGLWSLTPRFCEWFWLMMAYIVLFSALLSRLTALACGSTWVTSFIIIAHLKKKKIHRSGVRTALARMVPHETAAVSARSVYTIQPCTMSLHAKPHT